MAKLNINGKKSHNPKLPKIEKVNSLSTTKIEENVKLESPNKIRRIFSEER